MHFVKTKLIFIIVRPEILKHGIKGLSRKSKNQVWQMLYINIQKNQYIIIDHIYITLFM